MAGTTFSKQTTVVDSIQTTNAAPLVVYSIAVPQNKAVFVRVSFMSVNTAYTNTASGDLITTFTRNSGNVVRSDLGLGGGVAGNTVGNFTGQQPSVDTVANTESQSIDIKVTGKTATDIN